MLEPSRAPSRPWTADEDVRLTEAVARRMSLFGCPISHRLKSAAFIDGENTDNWKLIAESVPGRTNKACRKRWKHSLNPDVKKSAWTADEDGLLASLNKVYPCKWALIAQHISGRTDDACAKRYRESLDPSIKKDEWTDEEDKRLILEYQRWGGRWARVATELGRSGLGCRNRWRLLERKKNAAVRKGLAPPNISTVASSSSCCGPANREEEPAATRAVASCCQPKKIEEDEDDDDEEALDQPSWIQVNSDLGGMIAPTESDPAIDAELLTWHTLLASGSAVNRDLPIEPLLTHADFNPHSLPDFDFRLYDIMMGGCGCGCGSGGPCQCVNHNHSNQSMGGIESAPFAAIPPEAFMEPLQALTYYSPQFDDSAAMSVSPTMSTSPGLSSLHLLNPKSAVPSPNLFNLPLAPLTTPNLSDTIAFDPYSVQPLIVNPLLASNHMPVDPPLPPPSTVSSCCSGLKQTQPRPTIVPPSTPAASPLASAASESCCGTKRPLPTIPQHAALSATSVPKSCCSSIPPSSSNHVPSSLARDTSQRPSAKRPRLSASLPAASNPYILPYACGESACWISEDDIRARFGTSGELLEHRRGVHGEVLGTGSGGKDGEGKVFRCALKGCGKAWKSINGIQYHLQLSKAHFVAALSESVPAPQSSTAESSQPLKPPSKKLHVCTHPGCTNVYKQAAGLKYHLARGHPETAPAQLGEVPPALVEHLAAKRQRVSAGT